MWGRLGPYLVVNVIGTRAMSQHQAGLGPVSISTPVELSLAKRPSGSDLWFEAVPLCVLAGTRGSGAHGC